LISENFEELRKEVSFSEISAKLAFNTLSLAFPPKISL